MDVMRVEYQDLYGVEKLSPTRVAVTFSSAQVYQLFVRRWGTRTHVLPGSAVTVEVSDPWGPLTYVSVHGAPVQFPEDELSAAFRRYGEVVGQRHACLLSGRLKGLRMGARTLRMRLSGAIPSRVAVCGFYVRVFYQGQTRSCFRCGEVGHFAAACRAPRPEDPSVFHADDFPLLPEAGAPPVGPGSVGVPLEASSPAVPTSPSAAGSSALSVDSDALAAPASGAPMLVAAEVHRDPSVSLESDVCGVVPEGDPCAVASVLPEARGGVDTVSPDGQPSGVPDAGAVAQPPAVACAVPPVVALGSSVPRRKRAPRDRSHSRGPPGKRIEASGGVPLAGAPPSASPVVPPPPSEAGSGDERGIERGVGLGAAEAGEKLWMVSSTPGAPSSHGVSPVILKAVPGRSSSRVRQGVEPGGVDVAPAAGAVVSPGGRVGLGVS